jgi:hypothetical protein
MYLAAKQTRGIIPNVRPLIACLPSFPEKDLAEGNEITITNTTARKMFKAMNLQVLDFVGTACISRRAWNLRMDSQRARRFLVCKCTTTPPKDNRDNSRVPTPNHAANPNPRNQYRFPKNPHK